MSPSKFLNRGGADGTLLGEGLGMFAMKRLADAERDGDRIYAVLKGLGASSAPGPRSRRAGSTSPPRPWRMRCARTGC